MKKSKPSFHYLKTMNFLRSIFNCPTTSLTFYHVWTIENFASFMAGNCAWRWPLSSGHFCPPNNEQFKLDLRIYPSGSQSQGSASGVPDNNYHFAMGLFCCQVPHNYDGKIKCQRAISIVSRTGSKQFSLSKL